MSENLNGAYDARHPPSHSSAGKHCTNSGTCILVCCYINALGKVLLKGGPSARFRRDFVRFDRFLQACMNDFVTESASRSWPATPKGRRSGEEWLYEVFRCGFVHGFYPGSDVAWGRNPGLRKYWFSNRSRLTLNIDEFKRGFERGLQVFRAQVVADPDLRARFKDYILAD
jgi:hypothetical protein